jgi:hypothetical protein
VYTVEAAIETERRLLRPFFKGSWGDELVFAVLAGEWKAT